MKALVLAVFAVAALAVAPVSVAEISNLGSDQAYEHGSGSSESTVIQPTLNEYTIGLSGPNFCMTKTIKAESESQAMDMARQSCEKCRIEDLTGKMEFGEAPWEIAPKSDTFCQIELK